MQHTTEWTLYRNGKDLKLAIVYVYKTSPKDIDSKNSIRILSTNPDTTLTPIEWDSLMVHCLTDLDLRLGNAFLAELDSDEAATDLIPR